MDFSPQSTAAQVIAILESQHGFREQGGQWIGNNPFKPGSDSKSFRVTINDAEGEHGAYYYFAGNEAGSLYDLAQKLGVQLPSELPRTETVRDYEGLQDYAEAHGLSANELAAAGWTEVDGSVNWTKRKALKFPTASGDRWRFLDTQKPKYDSHHGYQRCWYGLGQAITKAQELSRPIIWVNGEVSVLAAHKRGIPAFCITSGENVASPELLDELKEKWQGTICVCLDSDDKGRLASKEIAEQLYKSGFVGVRVIDMKLVRGGDIADFCMLFHNTAFVMLMQRSHIPTDTSGYQLAIEYAALGKILSAGALGGQDGRLALHRMSKLTEVMFMADPRHAPLWLALNAASEPTPMLTKIKLAEMGKIDAVSDKYVDELAKAKPVESERALQEQVIQQWEKRQALEVFDNLKARIVVGDKPAQQMIEEAIAELRRAVPTYRTNFTTTDEAIRVARAGIDPNIPPDDAVAAYMPFPSLHPLGGMCEVLIGGKMVGVAALTGGGKSTWIETVMEALADQGMNIAIYGPEWSPDQALYRRIQRYGGPSFTRTFKHIIWKRLGKGDAFDAEDYRAYQQAEEHIQRKPGRIYYFNEARSMRSIVNAAHNLDSNLRVRDSRLHVVVIDYIQRLVGSAGKDENAGASANAVVNEFKEFIDSSMCVGFMMTQVTKMDSRKIEWNAKKSDDDDDTGYDHVLDEYSFNFVRADQVNLALTINPTKRGKREHILYVAKNSVGASGGRAMIPIWLDWERLEFVDNADHARVAELQRLDNWRG